MKYLIALLFLVVSFNVWSLELDEARSKKMVTESGDGYIKALDPKAKGLEDKINGERKKAYEEIVKQNGGKLSLKQVEEQAGKKLREKYP
jgi:uncharacterized protein YdbL (DUF1318 family)